MLVRPEQRLDPPAQLGVAGTLAIEEGVPCVSVGNLHRSQEGGLHAFGIDGHDEVLRERFIYSASFLLAAVERIWSAALSRRFCLERSARGGKSSQIKKEEKRRKKAPHSKSPERLGKPGTGVGPLLPRLVGGDAQSASDLLVAKAREMTQLDHSGGESVFLREPRQRLIQG